MSSTARVACWFAALTLCVARTAFAQGGEDPQKSDEAPDATPPSDAPVEAPSQELPEKAKDKKEKATPPPPPERSSIEEDMDFEPRFRSGVGVSYGAFFPGPVHFFGLEGRAGFQINDLMGICSTAGVMFGFHNDVVSEGGNLSFERSFGGLGYASILFEVTFVDSIYVALGPELAGGAIIQEEAALSADEVEAGGDVSVFYGFLPGARARVGFGFGDNWGVHRKQFTFGFDAHLLVGQRVVVQGSAGGAGLTLGAGTGPAVGILPAVFLGYDSK